MTNKTCVKASGSPWVEQEVETAARERARRRPTRFTVHPDLGEAVMESREGWASLLKRTCHIGDFRQWNDPAKYVIAFERLLRDLREGQR